MVGCFNCPITGVRLQPTVRLQLFRMISEKKKKAATAPITEQSTVKASLFVLL